MLSAMYENGGNTTHRLLDGHPQLFVYPFESQLGTALVHDHLTSMFPFKYRWPEFALDATPEQDYRAIIDEETKVRARTPQVSKFRHVTFDFSDDERARLYGQYVRETSRSRANNVAAFFRATFDAWKDYRRTNDQRWYVGYSPIIAVDAGKIIADLPEAHILHVVRNPWSAYADTKKRPVPLPLERYVTGWCITQFHAIAFKAQHPQRVSVLRYEDIIANPTKVLGALCTALGLSPADSLAMPSWNGTPLGEVFPWGTIRAATVERNRATAAELSPAERDAVRVWAQPYLETFDYKNMV
jgi:hypothetical protein